MSAFKKISMTPYCHIHHHQHQSKHGKKYSLKAHPILFDIEIDRNEEAKLSHGIQDHSFK